MYSSTAAVNGPHVETGTVSVPTTAIQGITRMRVVNVETTLGTSVNPCGTYTWGETEDYFVNISAPPTCPQPSAPTLVSSSLNNAVIDWTPVGTETQWQVQYGPQGFALGTGTTVTVTAHPYTVPGLAPYSFYQAYVRAICTAGDSSYWTPAVSWNTYNQGQYIQFDNILVRKTCRLQPLAFGIEVRIFFGYFTILSIKMLNGIQCWRKTAPATR